MNIGTRVVCRAHSHLYGETGEIVSSAGERRKVIFDKDRHKSDDLLAFAYWFFWDELERI